MAENNLKLTLAQIAQTKYHAPFDGTVTKIVSYNGSAFNDNDVEMEVTQGHVKVDTRGRLGLVCSRWPGVLDLKVQLGEKVKKGQLIFKINADMLEAQKKVDENISEYNKLVYEMNKKLHETKTVSYYSFYKSYVAYQESLKNVKIDNIKLIWSKQYAPFDSTVTEIVRCDGSGIGEAKPVLTITASE